MLERLVKKLGRRSADKPKELDFIGSLPLPKLLEQIEVQRNPINFKEAMLQIVQLYFDGLVEDYEVRQDKIWKEQSEALDALLQSAKLTVSNFYDGNPSFERAKEIVTDYAPILIKHGSKEGSKLRRFYNDGHLIKYFSIEVAPAFKKKEINCVIPVASGGFEPGLLVAGHLENSRILPVRYSDYSRDDKTVLVPTQAPSGYAAEEIRDKNVLIIDDVVDRGRTLGKVLEWIQRYKPQELYFAAVVVNSYLDKFGLEKLTRSDRLYRLR